VAYGRTVRRGGSYNRLAEPSWANPLDTSYSLRRGGRWNPPASFGALYLDRDLRMARLQVLHKLSGHPYGVEDLDEAEQHDLVDVEVVEREWLDCVTVEGLESVGLPVTYPRHRNGDRFDTWTASRSARVRSTTGGLGSPAAPQQ
jgi:RES domain-containing protein